MRSRRTTLVVPAGASICILIGIAMGVVNLTIELLDTKPTSLNERERWEAISEVSFQATSADSRIGPLMELAPPPFDRFTLPHGPGWYRVRSHAIGRALDFDTVVADRPRAAHRVQLWRAPDSETGVTLDDAAAAVRQIREAS